MTNLKPLTMAELYRSCDPGQFSFVTTAAGVGSYIYAVQTVDAAIELLAGIPAGEADYAGNYPSGTINARVVARLAAWPISSARKTSSYSATDRRRR